MTVRFPHDHPPLSTRTFSCYFDGFIKFLGFFGKSEGNLFPTGSMMEMANLLQEFSPDAVYEDRLSDHRAEKRVYTKKGMQDYMNFYNYYKSELPNFIK